MGSIFLEDGENNTTCTCGHKCCYLEGCCYRHPLRRLDDPPVIRPYRPISLPAVFGARRRPGPSLLDLPAEIRQNIYRLVVLTQKMFDMSLDPTPRLRSRDNLWGSRNRFALLATCRQIYHDVSPLAYGDNLFRIDRGLHRDFRIPRAPGMPFEKIRYLQLRYPRYFGACTWNLGHTWEHWLQDALHVTRRFPNLKHLVLQISYNDTPSLNLHDNESWEPIFDRGSTALRIWTERVKKVVEALAEINGRRMPACVRIHVGETMGEVGDERCLEALNVAIPLAFGRYVSISEYMSLYPSPRDETD